MSALEPDNHFVSGGISGGVRENHTDGMSFKSNSYFDYSSLFLAPYLFATAPPTAVCDGSVPLLLACILVEVVVCLPRFETSSLFVRL